MRARTVGGHALCLDLQPDKPLVGHDKFQFRRLGDNGPIGPVALGHGQRAQPGVLLIHDGGHDDVAAQAQAARLGRGEQARRHAALHVIRAAAVEPAAFDARLKWLGHTRHADSVDVAVEQQRTAAARPAGNADDVGPARLHFFDVDFQPGGAQPIGDEGADGRLARRAGDEIGVDGVDGDQVGQELLQNVHMNLAYFTRPTSETDARPCS